jgi:ketosteroid isomerase-like protein
MSRISGGPIRSRRHRLNHQGDSQRPRGYNSGMLATGGAMNEETAVIRVLADYYAAFSTLDVQAVLPYFHEPSVLIGPQGVLAAPTYAVLTTVFTPAMEGLRAKGFGRSELSVRNLKSLSATATLVTGVAVRYRVDGQEFERVGVTYVLYKADTRWRIAVLIVHDANEVALDE